MKISRRLSPAFLALLGLALCGAPATAAAEEEPTPTVTIKAKAVPIPGFPGTGNFYGKGADVEATMEIEGSGYGKTPQNPSGGIPPLAKVNVWLPKGVKLDTKDFKTACTEAILKNTGPSACPKKSVASPVGSVLGEVTFGTTRVPEEATLQAFFGPGGGLLFFTHGSSPVNLEIVSSGRYVRSSGKYSWELETLVPPVASVPGAPLASLRNRSEKGRMPQGRFLREGRTRLRRHGRRRTRIRDSGQNGDRRHPRSLPEALDRTTARHPARPEQTIPSGSR